MIKNLDYEQDIYEGLPNISKDEVYSLINKLKTDKRFNINISEECAFYKEEDEEQLKQDYPQLTKIFEMASSLDDYIQWTYGNEDIYIESDNYTFRIKADDIAEEIKNKFHDKNDDILFNDLKEQLNKAVSDARKSLIELYLSNLISEVIIYANKNDFRINLQGLLPQ